MIDDYRKLIELIVSEGLDTIESLTDTSGEGGQLLLRGTTYQYGLDNYNGQRFRLFRENDGTGASGAELFAISGSGRVQALQYGSGNFTGLLWR